MSTLVASLLLLSPAASAQLAGPSAPPNLVAQATAPGEIALAWDAASSLTGVTGYRVYRVEGDGNLTHVGDAPAEDRRFVESGIGEGVTRTYVVRAVDMIAEGPASEPASATTWTAPAAPRLVAVASGPGALGEATLTWDAPEADGGAPVSAYVIYRDGELVTLVDGAARAWTDAGLAPLRAYRYQVSAVNAVGEGALSDEACGVASPWAAELGCQAPL